LKMGDGGEMEGRLASKKMLARYTAMLEDFFQPLDYENQERMLSTYMTAEYYHSWPVKRVMQREEFVEQQRAIQEACTTWNFRAKVLEMPTQCLPDGPIHEVHVVTQASGVHDGTLKARRWTRPQDHQDESAAGGGGAARVPDGLVFNEEFPATNKFIVMPTELIKVTFSAEEPLVIKKLEFSQIIETAESNTGGLAGMPGRVGRPLPPPATELLAPIPPYTAPDNRDPNFKLRIQVFKQLSHWIVDPRQGELDPATQMYEVSGKRDMVKETDRDQIRDLIAEQKRELRQHMDYLNSIRNYCD